MPFWVSASSTRWEKTKPPSELRLRLHALAVDHQLVDDGGDAVEREVEGHRGVGRDVALGRGVRDVALVPQRDIFQGRDDGAAYHAGEARQVLGQHRIALVRHGGAALLPLGEELLGFPHLGALQVADLGGEVLDGGGDDGQRREERGMAIARDHLRGDRLDARPSFLATCSSTRGSTLAKVPTGPEMAQVAISARAATSRARLRVKAA